jgi:hypothetical protein
MVLPTIARRATVAIKRLGEECVISEPSGATTTDDYGKSEEDDSFSPLDSEHLLRVYGSRGSEPSTARATGGRRPADSPLMILKEDTVAKDGHRVTYLGTTYELDALTRYPSHIEASTTLIN